MNKRPRLTKLLVATLLFGAVMAIALCLSWAFSRGSASASNGLTCSVKASCDTGEVAVFRMSSTTNAHAGTPDGSSYGSVVCCGGVDSLGNSCSGNFDTVLTLSATDNAHVASDASYPVAVCLSVGANQAAACNYGPGCDSGFTCLATISGNSNAHVADCDGSDDYATKVCCGTSLTGPVGGLAELPDVGEGNSSGRMYVAVGGLAVVAALLALTTGAWYARRRWLR
jgi:hypothetical protein